MSSKVSHTLHVNNLGSYCNTISDIIWGTLYFVFIKNVCFVLLITFVSIVCSEFILECFFLRWGNSLRLTISIKCEFLCTYLHRYVYTIGVYFGPQRATKHRSKICCNHFMVLLRYPICFFVLVLQFKELIISQLYMLSVFLCDNTIILCNKYL